ncbi:MAG: Uncharacterised protein [Synechococcus sp. CC9902]|nr:MAG: Uncharacterised protein [Synechococcus sp. CC9902]
MEILRLEGQESKQPRPAHQSLVHLEVGVLRGGSDQGDGAVLHPGQQRILLGAVETVHFINEQNRAQPVALKALPGSIDLESQILHAGEHGVEAAEVRPGMAGDDPGQSRLADTGRPMQDQVANPVSLDGTAQQTSVGEDSALPFKLLEVAWPHAISQRCKALALLFSLEGEEVLTQLWTSSGPNRAFLNRIKQVLAIPHIIQLFTGSMCALRCV